VKKGKGWRKAFNALIRERRQSLGGKSKEMKRQRGGKRFGKKSWKPRLWGANVHAAGKKEDL